MFKNKPKKIISIDFGCAVSKIALLEVVSAGYQLLNYDTKGILATDEKFSELALGFINNFIQQNSIVDRDVVLSINEPESLIVKYLDLPILPKDEILEAAKWQLKDEVSFDLAASVIDWQVAREYALEDGAKRNGIIFAVAKKETIDKYLSFISKCGLNPLRISIGAFNYANLLKLSSRDSAVAAVLDIGYRDSVLSIYNHNQLNFIRRLVFSSEKLTRSLTGSLISDAGKVELSLEQAENIKKDAGIPLDQSLLLGQGIKAGQVLSLMRPFLEGLTRELRASFDYYAANFNAAPPAIIYITGGTANLKNLGSYLSKEINIGVSCLPIPNVIDVSLLDKDRLNKEQNSLMNVLSAGVMPAQSVNLVPGELKKQKAEAIERISLRAAAVFLAGVFLLLFFIAKFQINDYKNRLKNAQLHLVAIEDIRLLKQKIDSRQDLINKICKGSVPLGGALKLVSALAPEKIILDELIASQDNHSLVLRGKVSAGEAVAEDVLTQFMQALEASSFISEARLASLKNQVEAQVFEVNCELAYEK